MGFAMNIQSGDVKMLAEHLTVSVRTIHIPCCCGKNTCRTCNPFELASLLPAMELADHPDDDEDDEDDELYDEDDEDEFDQFDDEEDEDEDDEDDDY